MNIRETPVELAAKLRQRAVELENMTGMPMGGTCYLLKAAADIVERATSEAEQLRRQGTLARHIADDTIRIQQEVLKQAVRDESELEDELPPEMYAALQGDKDACTIALRELVKQTKQSILDRMESLKPDPKIVAAEEVWARRRALDHALGTSPRSDALEPAQVTRELHSAMPWLPLRAAVPQATAIAKASALLRDRRGADQPVDEMRQSQMSEAQRANATEYWLWENFHNTREPQHIEFLLDRLAARAIMQERIKATLRHVHDDYRASGMTASAEYIDSVLAGLAPGAGDLVVRPAPSAIEFQDPSPRKARP